MCCLTISDIFEPAKNKKTYNKTCATSKDSDQTAPPLSLIKVFSDRMCILQPPDYLKKNQRELLLYWAGVQAYRSFVGNTCLTVGFLVRFLFLMIDSRYYHASEIYRYIQLGLAKRK